MSLPECLLIMVLVSSMHTASNVPSFYVISDFQVRSSAILFFLLAVDLFNEFSPDKWKKALFQKNIQWFLSYCRTVTKIILQPSPEFQKMLESVFLRDRKRSWNIVIKIE